MTIRKGKEWGRESHAETVVTVLHDHELSEKVSIAKIQSAELQVQGGDTWLALGRPEAIDPSGLTLRLSFDAIRVTVKGQSLLAYSSIVARRHWWRGGPLLGTIWCVSLTGMFRGRNITPRAHANDGLLDVLCVNEDMTLRQRIQAWSRARLGDHLPHRGIDVARVQSVDISSPQAMTLIVDGKRQRNVRDVRLDVVADEWSVSVPRFGVSEVEASPSSEENL
jgi:hypothetical protein